MPHSFSCSLCVSSYDCDACGALSPVSLLHWIQDTAERHASQLDFGYEFCARNRLAWVERRLAIAIHRLPRWKEEVIATTWTFPHSPLVAIRNFSLTSPDGEQLVEASCEWVLIDLDKRRPVPLSKYIATFPDASGTVLAMPSHHDNEGKGTTETRGFRAEWTDIDFNGHVNNAVYLRWAIDSLTEGRQHDSISHITMNFRHECHWGDDIITVRKNWGDSEEVSLLCGEELRAEVFMEFIPASR